MAFIAVWIICFFYLTLTKFFPPGTAYSSSARIQLAAENQNELKLVHSPEVLKSVMGKLDLMNVWLRRWGVPEGKLENVEPWQVLSGQIALFPVKNSNPPQTDITSFSENANETALIANCVAETFRDLEQQKKIDVRIVERAQPALKPWKQPRPFMLGALDIAYTTFYAAIWWVLVVLAWPPFKKFVAFQFASPVASKFTAAPIKQKY